MKSIWNKTWGIVLWTAMRKRALLFSVFVVQIIFSISLIFGMPLIAGHMSDADSVRFVVAGWHIGIISIGTNLVSQMMSTWVKEGYIEFEKTYPIPRLGIVCAEALTWVIITIPSLVIVPIAGFVRFGIVPRWSLRLIAVLLLTLVLYVLFGLAMSSFGQLAFMQVLSEVITVVAMLFSPLMYPADRLPAIAVQIHTVLPFMPMNRLITEAASIGIADVPHGSLTSVSTDFIIVSVWVVIFAVISYIGIRRRK